MIGVTIATAAVTAGALDLLTFGGMFTGIELWKQRRKEAKRIKVSIPKKGR